MATAKSRFQGWSFEPRFVSHFDNYLTVLSLRWLVMIVSVSGYNASGKSTLVRFLAQELKKQGIPCRTMKFDRLFPSAYLTHKRSKRAEPKEDGTLSLRIIEGQTGSWDRPFRCTHFVNALGAICAVLAIRVRFRHTVIIFDRYFGDRFVHFRSSKFLLRVAKHIAPRPTIGFVLLPSPAAWEKRILARLNERFSLNLSRLSELDRAELNSVIEKYEHLCRSDSTSVAIDSANEAAKQTARELLLTRVGGIPDRFGRKQPGSDSNRKLEH